MAYVSTGCIKKKGFIYLKLFKIDDLLAEQRFKLFKNNSNIQNILFNILGKIARQKTVHHIKRYEKNFESINELYNFFLKETKDYKISKKKFFYDKEMKKPLAKNKFIKNLPKIFYLAYEWHPIYKKSSSPYNLSIDFYLSEMNKEKATEYLKYENYMANIPFNGEWPEFLSTTSIKPDKLIKIKKIPKKTCLFFKTLKEAEKLK